MISYSEECPQIVRDFINYCFMKNLSEGTIKQYYFDLMKFVKYFARFKPENFDLIEIEKITIQDLVNYIVLTTKELAKPTRARKVASLKSFYKWMYIKEKLINENITEGLDSPKITKKQPLYLSVDECKLLLSVVDGEFKERDIAIIYTFLLTGIRLSELCGINLSDLKDNTLKVLGKGDKERTIPLSDTCINAIENYMKVRIIPKFDKDALFTSTMKRRISPSLVEKMIHKYILKAGLNKKYSVHKLRHSFGTISYQYGNNDIRALQELMGHSSIQSTTIYTHNNKEQLRYVIDSNPLNKK
jgi:site-specific recombinase XerD